MPCAHFPTPLSETDDRAKSRTLFRTPRALRPTTGHTVPVSHWVTPAIIAGLVLLAVLVRLRVGPSQRLDDSPGATLARAIEDTTGQPEGFEVVAEWKEAVHYWEGGHSYRFDADWTITPGVTYVPAPEIWDSCVPVWMRERREEIVGRLRTHSGHEPVDSTAYASDEGVGRSERR